jgi:hypothetical protein
MTFADAAAELAPGQALKIRDIQVQGAQDALGARVYTAGVPGAKQPNLMVFFHGGGFVDGDLDDADDFLRCLVLATPTTWCWPRTTRWQGAAFPRRRGRCARRAAVGEEEQVQAGLDGQADGGVGHRGRRQPGRRVRHDVARPGRTAPRGPGADHAHARSRPVDVLDAYLAELPDLAEVADQCAAAYRGYLPNAADRSHPYASPLQSSRLKNLPPALILSSEDDPLRDEAEQYGEQIDRLRHQTTVRRMAAAPLQDASARNECACKVQVLSEIAVSSPDWGRNPSHKAAICGTAKNLH